MKTNAGRIALAAMAVMLAAACSLSVPATQPSGPSGPPVAVRGDPGQPVGPGQPADPGQPVGPGQPIGTQPLPGVPGAGGLPGSQPTFVVPKPGRLDVHPVGATKLDAQVDGRQVRVTVTWWSGVAPCSVLDSVALTRDGTNVTIELREGADQLGVACIQIAMLRATVVDLGTLAPGVHAISAWGVAAPIRVTVP